MLKRIFAVILALTQVGCMREDNTTTNKNLRWAIDERNVAAVDALLATGAFIDEQDFEGRTPLITATVTDQFVIAEKLIDRGADVMAADQFGTSALEFIATSREVDYSPDGQARLRIVARIEAAGLPYPPPPRDMVVKLRESGMWKSAYLTKLH